MCHIILRSCVQILLPVYLCFFVVSASNNDTTDFLAANVLPDGEIELRIRYHGITAKETTVSSRSDTKITLRQLTDGNNFIQLIYDEFDNIRDCEYLHEGDQIHKFLKNFQNDLDNLIATSNITIEAINGRTIPKNISRWLNYHRLKKMCKKNHQNMKSIFRQYKKNKNKTSRTTEKFRHERPRKTRAISDYLIMPGTFWCGYDDVAQSYTNLGGMSLTDKCCRKHDHCKMNIHGFTRKYDFYNPKPFTVSHCWCDNRRKRDIAEMFHMPGTEWCGKGFTAKKYTHLGGFSRTDKCCRVHDTACPFWIGGFETKYGLFNWRVNTIMHCSCDDRFRACLKMADTSDSNLVGKVFFNIVQTKCFVLKPKKVCKRRSWWGKCTKKKYTKQAILRDNLSY